MSTLFTVLLLLHIILFITFSTKTFLSIWYINGQVNIRRARRQSTPVHILAVILTWGMISTLGLVGGYIFFLRHEKLRFFTMYTEEELNQRVDVLVEWANKRDQRS